MKNIPAILILALFPAVAAAQDAVSLRADFPESRAFPMLEGQGGQVAEEWVTPQLRASLAVYGRVSFPGSSNVTQSGVTYADILNPGLGLSVEGDLLAEVAPHFALGGYLSVEKDWFGGQSNVDMLSGEVFTFNTMEQTMVIVGAKMLEHVSPWVSWEGRIGGGLVRYGELTYTAVFPGPPIAGQQFFRPINRGVFELGGRICFGDRHFELDLGVGLRIMGAAAPGNNVSFQVDPDFFFTYTFEVGLTIRF